MSRAAVHEKSKRGSVPATFNPLAAHSLAGEHLGLTVQTAHVHEHIVSAVKDTSPSPHAHLSDAGGSCTERKFDGKRSLVLDKRVVRLDCRPMCLLDVGLHSDRTRSR